MNRSKKIFVSLAILFIMGLGYVSYDISSRTTFPGSKPQLQERIKKQFSDQDSTSQDSLKATYR